MHALMPGRKNDDAKDICRFCRVSALVEKAVVVKVGLPRLLRFQTHLVVCVRSLILPPMFGLSLLRRDCFDRQATSRHEAAGGTEVLRRPFFAFADSVAGFATSATSPSPPLCQLNGKRPWGQIYVRCGQQL